MDDGLVWHGSEQLENGEEVMGRLSFYLGCLLKFYFHRHGSIVEATGSVQQWQHPLIRTAGTRLNYAWRSHKQGFGWRDPQRKSQ